MHELLQLRRKAIAKKPEKKVLHFTTSVVNSWTNVGYMKNDLSKKQPSRTKKVILKTDDASVEFPKHARHLPATQVFSFSDFKKIADKAPFSQSEWASILHVSERTLQRYAKNNGSFASINAERAMQIVKVLKEAKVTFGNLDKFYNWIKKDPYMLEGNLSFHSLTTYDGIEKILTQLGRIQHGILA